MEAEMARSERPLRRSSTMRWIARCCSGSMTQGGSTVTVLCDKWVDVG
jgi:hypothetical protein